MSAEPVTSASLGAVPDEAAALHAAAPANGVWGEGSDGATRGPRHRGSRFNHPLLDTRRPLGRALRLLLVAGVLAGAIALGIPLCPFAILTRHPCPGCGLTRATLALAHGRLHDALHFHPLVFLITPVIGVAFTYNALAYVRKGEWFASEGLRSKWLTRAWLVLGAAMMLLWISRFFGAFGGPVAV